MDYAAALALIGPFEGRVRHMYLDVNGFVTVAIGNLLPDAQAACTLRFCHRGTTAEASGAEITDEFGRVAHAQKGMRASAYQTLTALDLPDDEIDRLFRRRVDEFGKELVRHWPKYPSYPVPAQLAMLDLVFNVGAGALSSKWPHLDYAIDIQNWALAAEYSHRHQSSEARNKAIHDLFLEAAREAGALPRSLIT